MIVPFNPLHPLAGFVVGMLVGLTGVGGGSLMTPLLTVVFGVNPVTAVGTDLVYAAVTKSAGTAAHGAAGTVDWGVTARLAAGSLPAAALTLAGLHWMGPLGAGAARAISVVLAGALLFTAAVLLARPLLERMAARADIGRAAAAIVTLGMGAALGVLVPLSSIGAGAIGVTALTLLYPRMPAARVVGTDIAHAVLLSMVAGAGHWLMGSVDWPLLAALLAGSLPGVLLGSWASAHVPVRVLRPILAVTLIVVAGKVLL